MLRAICEGFVMEKPNKYCLVRYLNLALHDSISEAVYNQPDRGCLGLAVVKAKRTMTVLKMFTEYGSTTYIH